MASSTIKTQSVTKPGSAVAPWRWFLRGWQMLRSINPHWLWAINLIAIVVVIAWLLFDARFEASVDWWRFNDSSIAADQRGIRDMGDWWWLEIRNRTVQLLGGVVLAAFSLLFWGLWVGPKQSRT